MSNDTRNMYKAETRLPEYHLGRLRAISAKRQISMLRLMAFAIDNELMKEVPFDFPTNLRDDDYEPYTFAEESAKILDFIKTLRRGAGLDILLLLRFKIGIEDKATFLAAFQECLDTGAIEAFKPKRKSDLSPLPEDYFYYCAKGATPTTLTKEQRAESKYKKFLKDKEKYDKKGM